MNYQRLYDVLIAKRRIYPPHGEYNEMHHIVPRCLGGSDDPSNLVALTAREHFVAHQLLAKIHGGKLLLAAFRMSNYKKYGARKYEWLKRRHAQTMSLKMRGRTVSAETKRKLSERTMPDGWRERISRSLKGKMAGERHPNYGKCIFVGADNPFYGRRHTTETKAKISAKKCGKKASAETRKKMSAVRIGNQNAKGTVMSTERKRELSLIMKGNTFSKGRVLSESHKEKIAASLKRAYSEGRRAA